MEYYEILGLEKGASESEIKKAYYKLARENHPDKVEADKREEATKRFQKIGEAYEVLSDPEKRQLYDQYGKEGLSANEGGGQNPFDMFSQMFGNNFNFGNFGGGNFGGANFGGFNVNMNGRNKQKNQKNRETVFPLNVSLTDVYKGLEKKLKVTRKIIVKKSEGDVKEKEKEKEKVDVKDYESTWKQCEKCGGNGAVLEARQVGPNMFSQSQRSCAHCSGKGFILLPEYELEETSEIIHVILEKGVNSGKQVLFPNLGNASPGYLPGDLIVLVQTGDREKGFIRDGNNLIYHKKIKLVDALCNTNFSIQTLDDRTVKISYKDVITPNEKRIVPKEGINSGNLIIVFEIEFPAKIENKDKLRNLLSQN
jgi:DnaJ family protein A protein 2